MAAVSSYSVMVQHWDVYQKPEDQWSCETLT